MRQSDERKRQTLNVLCKEKGFCRATAQIHDSICFSAITFLKLNNDDGFSLCAFLLAFRPIFLAILLSFWWTDHFFKMISGSYRFWLWEGGDHWNWNPIIVERPHKSEPCEKQKTKRHWREPLFQKGSDLFSGSAGVLFFYYEVLFFFLMRIGKREKTTEKRKEKRNAFNLLRVNHETCDHHASVFLKHKTKRILFLHLNEIVIEQKRIIFFFDLKAVEWMHRWQAWVCFDSASLLFFWAWLFFIIFLGTFFF